MNPEIKYKGNILLIDDLSDNLQLFSDLLLLGYKVCNIKGDKIKDKPLKVKSIDITLLNIVDPKIDYFDILETIINNKNLQDCPLILIYREDESFNKEQLFTLKSIDYITRPFTFNELVKKIEIHLTIKRQQIALIREVNKRKQIKEILQHSRSLILSVLDSSLDAIASLQAVRESKSKEIKDFRCLIANPIFAKLLQSQQYDIIGKVGLKKLINKINHDFFSDFCQVIESGQELQKEFYYPFENSCWFLLIAVKLNDGLAVTMRDITISKQSEMRLQAMINLDGLTQVANRRRFDEYLEQQWEIHLDLQQPLTLMMIDIDYFKLYNDHYGHQKGDECIVRVAQCILMVVKSPTDLVARYGGEEFAIILPNTKIEEGLMIADLIQSAISSLFIPHKKSKVSRHVTLSMGVSCMIPQEKHSLKDLINKADKALYRAKNEGRNQVSYG